MVDYDISTRISTIMSLDPQAPAMEFQGRWLPWSRLTSLGEEIQFRFAAAGLGNTDGLAIGMIMRNRPPIAAAILSAFTHRQTVVTISSMQPDEALAADVGKLPLAAVLGDPEDWARPGVREAAAAAGVLALSVSETSVEVIQQRRSDGQEIPTQPGTAVHMLTSGTTGPPKRIPLTYAGFNEGFAATSHYEGGGDEPRLRESTAIVFSPLLHVSGIFGLLLTVLNGRKLALMEKFSVDEWLALVTEHKPKALSLPPTALKMVMAADIDPERLSFARAVTVGTAPISAADAEAWEEKYGIPVLVVYGATEFAGGITGWTLRDHQEFAATKRGSVGRAHPGVELRIIDENTYEELATDEVGLLEVRAPQLGERGREWVRTSDRGRLDADGFLWIVGRADDVIIRGGFKVSTGTVAEAIKSHPQVRDAGVIGLPHARLGQVPVAGVQLEPGAQLTKDELLSFLREQLTPYQIPVDIRFFDELPRTPSMKVSGPGLEDLFREQVTV